MGKCLVCNGTGRFEGRFSGPGWPNCLECAGTGDTSGRSSIMSFPSRDVGELHFTLAGVTYQVKDLVDASTNDIRAKGWKLKNHQERDIEGVAFMYWTFEKDGRVVVCLAETDAQALNGIRIEIKRWEDGSANLRK